MSHYPFTAVVGSDDMALALILTTIAPDVGGVLVRGEKGTAKSTIVRGLVQVLPSRDVVTACRFGCDPAHPDPSCPDGPHSATEAGLRLRPRLVELPVGASEDRVTGSLDLGQALGAGVATFEPGLLAAAHRGLLYVDEVNLLHDHLVDLLLDAAAMGRNTVERDGVSFSHAARFVLIGTMNPEEGELRPQLLDRFGLTVEVAASRDPQLRAEIVRRRLAYDADPAGFAARFAEDQTALAERIAAAQQLLPQVRLGDGAVEAIARVCAGFEVDGMRADIVTARAARAHAAWQGRRDVARDDIRAAARLALPHRRRRKPFDAPGLDEDLLDRLLGADEPDPTEPDDQGPGDDPGPGEPGPDDPGPEEAEAGPVGQPPPVAEQSPDPAPEQAPVQAESDPPDVAPDTEPDGTGQGAAPDGATAAADDPYRAVALRARGVGRGAPGRRSRAITTTGRSVGSTLPRPGAPLRLHLPATIAAAAARRAASSSRQERLRLARSDLRAAVLEGPEANLVVFCVDTSGSMGARRRMAAVKTAVLSLLVDAYQRRDRVAVITFRGGGARLVLPPTSSVEAAAACLADIPHGGRTPLAEGLESAAELLAVERIRDPHQRPLVVLLTDGRATAGPDALPRSLRAGERWPHGSSTVLIDCETGRIRLGLAARLAAAMGARHLPLGAVDADALVSVVGTARERQDETTRRVA